MVDNSFMQGEDFSLNDGNAAAGGFKIFIYSCRMPQV